LAHLSAAIARDEQPDRERRLLGGLRDCSLGGTNLDGENLITVQTCICAVVRRTLKRGSDNGNDEQLTVAYQWGWKWHDKIYI